jgi:hypothetical protein
MTIPKMRPHVGCIVGARGNDAALLSLAGGRGAVARPDHVAVFFDLAI